MIRTATGQSVDKVKHPKKYSEDLQNMYGYRSQNTNDFVKLKISFSNYRSLFKDIVA